MTQINISSKTEPSKRSRFSWAQVFVRPFYDSCEQYTVGIIMRLNGVDKLIRANRLDRLDCLFPESSDATKAIIEIEFSEIDNIIYNFKKINGYESRQIFIGEWREAESLAPLSASQNRLASISAFHSDAIEEFNLSAQIEHSSQIMAPVLPVELRSFVLKNVAKQKPEFASRFANHVHRETQISGGKSNPILDYSGVRLFANIEDISGKSIRNLEKRIKLRMWDLKIRRDQNSNRKDIKFEMLSAPVNRIQFDSKRLELIESLRGQADIVELRFRNFDDPDQLSNFIIQSDAA